MTRKHFKAIAEILLMVEDKSQRTSMANSFAQLALSDNRLFDRARFFAACGL